MTSPSHMQQVAEEAILDHFRNPEHEPFHSDDLWHVIPDEHRKVISLAVMALVNKKLIVGCGYRKSAIPSRKRSPSQEYRLTELGRDRIAGVGAGVPSPQGPGQSNPGASVASARTRECSSASSHSGDRSTAGVTTGVASPQGTQSASHCSNGASSDPGDGSPAPSRQQTHGAGEPRPSSDKQDEGSSAGSNPPVRQLPAEEPTPLPGMEQPPSAYDPYSEAA